MAVPPDPKQPAARPSTTGWLFGLVILVLLLAIVSLNVGASSMNLLHLFTQPDDRLTQLLFVSRWPRTLALILAGAALAVSGLIMQMLARNRLVEPSMIGIGSAAAFGMLVCAIIAPSMSLWLKFSIVTICGTLGTVLFLAVLAHIPLRSALIVPLVGLVLAGVIYAGSSLVAHQFDLGQALRAWSSGDFSAVARGRYELLWLAAGVIGLAMLLADRFTLTGMGEDFATNVGVNYRGLMALGVVLVAMIMACVVIIAGVLPFIGLIVPNFIRLITGDQLRRAADEKGKTIVVVLHDINFASCYSDHIIAMRQGKLAYQGPPAALICNDVLSELYDLPIQVHELDGRRICLYF